MMVNKRICLLCLTGFIGLLSPQSWAREYYDDYEEFEEVGMFASVFSRIYFGAAAGTVEFDVGDIANAARSNNFLNQVALISDDSSTNGIGAKLFLGIEINEYVALEAGWASLGEWEFDIAVRGADPNDPGNFGQQFTIGGRVEIDTFIVGPVVSYDIPSTHAGVTGRLGLIIWDSSVSASISPVPNGSTAADSAFSETGSGSDLNFSLGAYYDLSKHLRVMGGWDRYDIKSGEESGLAIDLIYVGARIRL